MRFSLLIPFFLLIACQDATGQDKSLTVPPKASMITEVVTEFLAAADVRDVARLEAVLNPEFRVSLNQFMGTPGVTIIDRAGYLSMITAGKLGGTPRTVEFNNVEIVGNLAFVRTVIESDKYLFDSMHVLTQDALGDWTLLADTPYVTPKKP